MQDCLACMMIIMALVEHIFSRLWLYRSANEADSRYIATMEQIDSPNELKSNAILP